MLLFFPRQVKNTKSLPDQLSQSKSFDRKSCQSVVTNNAFLKSERSFYRIKAEWLGEQLFRNASF